MSIIAGGSNVYGLNIYGFVVCNGEYIFGQLNAPLGMFFQYSSLVLGNFHKCIIRNCKWRVLSSRTREEEENEW